MPLGMKTSSQRRAGRLWQNSLSHLWHQRLLYVYFLFTLRNAQSDNFYIYFFALKCIFLSVLTYIEWSLKCMSIYIIDVGLYYVYTLYILYHRVLVLCSSCYGQEYIYDVSGTGEDLRNKRIYTYIYFYFESSVCIKKEWMIHKFQWNGIEIWFNSCIFI